MLSGKGGVGKSTVATQLAWTLYNNGKKVLLNNIHQWARGGKLDLRERGGTDCVGATWFNVVMCIWMNNKIVFLIDCVGCIFNITCFVG